MQGQGGETQAQGTIDAQEQQGGAIRHLAGSRSAISEISGSLSVSVSYPEVGRPLDSFCDITAAMQTALVLFTIRTKVIEQNDLGTSQSRMAWGRYRYTGEACTMCTTDTATRVVCVPCSLLA